jgi:hypothetical protein
MKLIVVDKKSKAIMFQGEANSTEDFEELNRLYPKDQYERFVPC